MAEARVAVGGDIDGICELLHRRMSGDIPAERWRRLMTYGWCADKPDLGGVVEDAGRIVGYIGVIYADRTRQGRPFTTGNLTSWYLERPYRQGGIAMDLLRIATRHRDVVYTSFTSTARALALLRLGGLRPLDAVRRLWCPGAGEAGGAITVLSDIEQILPLLGPVERRLVEDHAGLAVHPRLIRTGQGDCLVMLSIHEKADAPARFEALYVGAPEIMAANAQAFADAVLPKARAELALDSRFLCGGGAEGAAREIPVARYYRPVAGVGPADIDALYSEIVLLDLTLW